MAVDLPPFAGSGGIDDACTHSPAWLTPGTTRWRNTVALTTDPTDAAIEARDLVKAALAALTTLPPEPAREGIEDWLFRAVDALSLITPPPPGSEVDHEQIIDDLRDAFGTDAFPRKSAA